MYGTFRLLQTIRGVTHFAEVAVRAEPHTCNELRRRRIEAGLSLSSLAKLVHYDKGHLSKIENGRKCESPQLAMKCDVVLGADGTLAALARQTAPEVPQPGVRHGDVWSMTLSADGSYEFRVISADPAGRPERPVLRSAVQQSRTGAGATDLAYFRQIFDGLRQLGQVMAPAALIPPLASLTNSLRTHRAEPELLVLGSRFAEFTGWMAQEAGDDEAALWWTDQAVELAAAGGDTDLEAYGYVRRALVTLYRQDAIETVALAQRARRLRSTARVQALAAQREAQGHAIAGDYTACRNALDHAAEHMRQAENDITNQPLLGISTLADPVAMVTGWCLYDLGRAKEATDILARELDRMPVHALRGRARFGTRLALALASQRELEHACTVADSVLTSLPRIDSATVRVELRHFARTLNRWHTNSTVRATMPKLMIALRSHLDPTIG